MHHRVEAMFDWLSDEVMKKKQYIISSWKILRQASKRSNFAVGTIVA